MKSYISEDDIEQSLLKRLKELVVSEILSGNHTELDLQHLSAGIYCLRIYTEDGAFSQSVVKE